MDEVIETLMEACGALGIRPAAPFSTVHDFESHLLRIFPGVSVEAKSKQLNWALQAIRAAEERKTSAVVQCIENIRQLSVPRG